MVRGSEIMDVTMPTAYHKGRASRADRIPAKERRFIAWDGEGMNLRGIGKPQAYVLLGCSTGERVIGPGLNTMQLIDFILDIGKRNPDGIHVGFAFSYDANMIVQSLKKKELEALHTYGYVKFQHLKETYVIQMRKGKWFSVSRYNAGYSRDHNPTAKATVRIFDIFSFFTCSFVKAVEDMLGANTPGLQIVKEGKAVRNVFEWSELEYVEKYWRHEIELLRLLAEGLRERMYGAGLYITSWHGPGALASYVMQQHKMKTHMKVNAEPIREAARYAYAGGRFELYKVGRITGPIYSMDINSAYPAAIAELPSLNDGEWVHTENPTRIARFGVYRVRLHRPSLFGHMPGPLFHRDHKHNISYPWNVEGWYWSPEVARLLGQPDVEVLEGWEYLGSQSRPFSWVEGMYKKRQEWKRDRKPQQLALKLCLNSMYGKLAQRVGYDVTNGRTPPWHQLEWAGWVTSYTRAMLYSKMIQIPTESLIAVETDGIYSTTAPALLGVEDSRELGGWETETYDEILYLQSGLAWLRQGDKWTAKRRGLDPDSMSLNDTINYVRSLEPNAKWAPYVAQSTRFVGIGAALQSSAPLKVKHCLWETSPRDVVPGEHGKRIHLPSACRACKQGENAYDMPHDLIIRSLSRAGDMSTPHNIPWEQQDDTTAEWREHEKVL